MFAGALFWIMFRETIYPYLLVLVQFACLAFLFYSAPVIAGGYAGILIESLGLFLGILAIFNMRIGNFNISPHNRSGGKLVTHGIYGVIRHPMYFAQLLMLLPLVIDYYSQLRLAAFLLLMVTLLLKIRYEEAHLVHHYEGYREYMQKTKKLIPYIF